jgi:hypothetical protein
MVIGGAIALWPTRKRKRGASPEPEVRRAEPAQEPSRVEAEVTA